MDYFFMARQAIKYLVQDGRYDYPIWAPMQDKFGTSFTRIIRTSRLWSAP